ncbi:hypothetical protein BJY04DRAFT_215639 [Aspergillus karnatakaensis]|uniref:uncharacterized protein n=1 Tax=Aspergillus karnatakaensis TaxID=1810916 RepID=UPI003CCD8039
MATTSPTPTPSSTHLTTLETSLAELTQSNTSLQTTVHNLKELISALKEQQDLLRRYLFTQSGVLSALARDVTRHTTRLQSLQEDLGILEIKFEMGVVTGDTFSDSLREGQGREGRGRAARAVTSSHRNQDLSTLGTGALYGGPDRPLGSGSSGSAGLLGSQGLLGRIYSRLGRERGLGFGSGLENATGHATGSSSDGGSGSGSGSEQRSSRARAMQIPRSVLASASPASTATPTSPPPTYLMSQLETGDRRGRTRRSGFASYSSDD